MRPGIPDLTAHGFPRSGEELPPVIFGRQKLTSLDNVFHLLDGRSRPNTYGGPLIDAIRQAQSGRGETEYFAFRCFKNGNLHITFRRLDLVRELNAVAGGKRLRTHRPVLPGRAA